MRTVSAFIAAHYRRFNVFQLMRLLLLQAERNAAPAPLALAGQAGGMHRVRFTADLSAGFPGHEFSEVSIGAAEPGVPAIRITTANYSLAGTLGPLPEPFAEWLRDQGRLREYAMRDFLDMFTQRLNVLRFELKAEMLLALHREAPEASAHACHLASLMGVGSVSLARQVDLPERSWLSLAAMLANCRRSAANIAQLLSLLFGAKAVLEEWIGAWRPIEAIDLSALGKANSRLGVDCVLGRRAWDQQARVRITIPGLDYRRACPLLPPATPGTKPDPAHRHLRALLRLLLDRQFDCEVRLQLLPATVPEARVTAQPERGQNWGVRLGQTAWVGPRAGAQLSGRPYCAAFTVLAFDPAEAA